MIKEPPWYTATENWLEANGWPMLYLGAAVIIGVTLILIAKRQATALAIWLTYLYMP